MTIYRDQLEAVYALIEKPEAWTQEYFARDAEGDGIDEDYDCNDEGEALGELEISNHPSAACWCLYGASYKCGIVDKIGFRNALGFKFASDVADFNDRHTHAEVLALLKQAIERAPVREQPK